MKVNPGQNGSSFRSNNSVPKQKARFVCRAFLLYEVMKNKKLFNKGMKINAIER